MMNLLNGELPIAQYQQEDNQLGSSWVSRYLKNTCFAPAVCLMAEGVQKYRQAQYQLR